MFLDASFLIYLNVGADNGLTALYKRLLNTHALATDLLAIDETLYISRKRYAVNYGQTLEFLDDAVLPFVRLLGLGIREYERAKEFLQTLRPSDAIHLAVMRNFGINSIVTEDEDFDKVNVERIWV